MLHCVETCHPYQFARDRSGEPNVRFGLAGMIPRFYSSEDRTQSGPWIREFLNIRALSTHKNRGTFCIANRSALSERVAQGNLSQFNSLDLALPWFVASLGRLRAISGPSRFG